MIEIWTDGSCIPNPGKGGYAWMSLCGKEGFGSETQSTNQRMEMKAVIEALKAFPEGNVPITIRTDSQFVIKGITQWIRSWIARGWTTAAGQPVKNQDLWKELWALVGKRIVVFQWVRGHNGDPMNEKVDQLANKATGATQSDREEMNRRIAAQKSWGRR